MGLVLGLNLTKHCDIRPNKTSGVTRITVHYQALQSVTKPYKTDKNELEGSCSIHLSYRRTSYRIITYHKPKGKFFSPFHGLI